MQNRLYNLLLYKYTYFPLHSHFPSIHSSSYQPLPQLISPDAVLTWFHPYVDIKFLASNTVSFSLPEKHSMHVEFYM